MKVAPKYRITSKIAYDVLWVEDRPDLDCWAWCDYDKKQIVLNVKLKRRKRELKKKLLHELFHAIEFEYGIQIPHSLIEELEEPWLKVAELNGWI